MTYIRRHTKYELNVCRNQFICHSYTCLALVCALNMIYIPMLFSGYVKKSYSFQYTHPGKSARHVIGNINLHVLTSCHSRGPIYSLYMLLPCTRCYIHIYGACWRHATVRIIALCMYLNKLLHTTYQCLVDFIKILINWHLSP